MALLTSVLTHAQTTFSVGPRVGGGLFTVHFQQVGNDYSKSIYRSGWSAGLAGEIGLGHWALQPAVLYEQGGFKSQMLYNNGRSTYDNRDDVRLQYVTIPLHVAYRQRATGQGVQAFAGPYLGLLLGGRYRSTSDNANDGFHAEGSATVSADPNASSAPGLVLQRVDAGLEGGVGYRYQGFLLHAGYRLGLRNVNSDQYYGLISFGSTKYRTRAFQASLTYLFGFK
ncbi:hypothetical protein AXW84_01955 [Hymenobacter sp. PAMC 26628]|nr:hypothetical protein AXW84_01955 [Hymenobacter sp. PAMC 26628]